MKSRILSDSSAVVDENAADVDGDEVARCLEDEIHVFVQQRRATARDCIVRRCRATCAATRRDRRSARRRRRPTAAVRTTVAMPSGRMRCTILRKRSRSVALSILRETPLYFPVGIKIKISAGQRDIRRDARAFEAARFFDDLHEHVVTAADLLVDRKSAAALRYFDVANVQRLFVDIVDIEKRVTAEADVDKAGSHSRKYVLNFSFINGADYFFFALDVILDELFILEDRDAVLPRIARDQDIG